MKSGTRSRAIVLAFRLALLILAAGAATLALWIDRSRDRPRDSSTRYVCPMHPDVTSVGPDRCPVCGMALERLESNDAPGAMIDPSTYLNYDIVRQRGTGPNAPAPAWVADNDTIAAILYKDELEGLSPEAHGMFYALAASSEGVPIRAIPGATKEHDRSTCEVRFRLDTSSALPHPGGVLAAGEVGRVRVIDRGRELPVIADTAILEGVDGPYVMVASPDRRTLAKRRIEIGKTFGGVAFVLSGLGPRDLVLTRSAFFIDAELKLRQKQAIEVRR